MGNRNTACIVCTDPESTQLGKCFQRRSQNRWRFFFKPNIGFARRSASSFIGKQKQTLTHHTAETNEAQMWGSSRVGTTRGYMPGHVNLDLKENLME